MYFNCSLPYLGLCGWLTGFGQERSSYAFDHLTGHRCLSHWFGRQLPPSSHPKWNPRGALLVLVLLNHVKSAIWTFHTTLNIKCVHYTWCKIIFQAIWCHLVLQRQCMVLQVAFHYHNRKPEKHRRKKEGDISFQLCGFMVEDQGAPPVQHLLAAFSPAES